MHVYYIDHLDLRASHLQRLFRDPQVQAQEALYGDAAAFAKIPVIQSSNVEAWLRTFAARGIHGEEAFALAVKEVARKVERIREPLVKLYERAKAKEPPKLKIYRAMTLYKMDELHRGRVGLYWSDTRACASAYWAEGAGQDYKITAEVNPDAVDWVATILQRYIYGEGECEITLRPGTKITLIDYRDRGDTITKFKRGDREAVAGLRRR